MRTTQGRGARRDESRSSPRLMDPKSAWPALTEVPVLRPAVRAGYLDERVTKIRATKSMNVATTAPMAPRVASRRLLRSAAAAAFDDVLTEPAVAVEGWFCRWFGRAWLSARVEWIGGVTAIADEPAPTDFGLVAAASLNAISWDGLNIFVPPLELQREVSVRRGLADRVRLIDSL